MLQLNRSEFLYTTSRTRARATGQAREDALAAVDGYLDELLAAAPVLRAALAG